MRVHANWFKLLLPSSSSSSSSPFISSRSSFSSRLSGNWDGMCRVEWIEETSFRIHRNLTLIRLCCNCNKMHRFAWQFGSVRISIRTRRRMIIIVVLHKRWSPTLHCGCTIFVPIKQLRHTHTHTHRNNVRDPSVVFFFFNSRGGLRTRNTQINFNCNRNEKWVEQ